MLERDLLTGHILFQVPRYYVKSSVKVSQDDTLLVVAACLEKAKEGLYVPHEKAPSPVVVVPNHKAPQHKCSVRHHHLKPELLIGIIKLRLDLSHVLCVLGSMLYLGQMTGDRLGERAIRTNLRLAKGNSEELVCPHLLLDVGEALYPRRGIFLAHLAQYSGVLEMAYLPTADDVLEELPHKVHFRAEIIS